MEPIDFSIFSHNFDVDKEYIEKVHNNYVYNNVIIDYYKRLQKEFRSESKNCLLNISDLKIDGIKMCNQFWTIEKYDYLQIKDFIRTNLCHDKFCNNCKKVKQACRMSRYIPHIEKYKDKLYHLILTVPNVKGIDLKDTIKKMNSSFYYLIRYLNGKAKILNINFMKYGYLGAIRSFEITFKGDIYHPHFHVALAFNNLDLEKKFKNTYSIDFKKSREDTLFSEFEILIQKIWYLLMNDIKVSFKNINELDLGYSCMCNKFNDDDYAELFKYMTKETDEEKNILTYDNFKTIYLSTYHLRQIQGYGCFYRIIDENLDDEVDKIYTILTLSDLRVKERPQEIRERPIDLLNDVNYTLISRKKIYQYLKNNDIMN